MCNLPYFLSRTFAEPKGMAALLVFTTSYPSWALMKNVISSELGDELDQEMME
jgi:hypothetical protein